MNGPPRSFCTKVVVLVAVLSAGCGEAPAEASSFGDVVGAPLTEAALRASVENEFRVKEDLIQECMAEEGFEYIAWVEESILPGPAEGGDLDRGEFAEVYEFGISTIEVTPPQANPNLAIRDALGDVEQASYDKALYGDTPDEHLATSEVGPENAGDAGCQQHAFDIFNPGIDGPSEAEMAAYYELVDHVDERVGGDDRVIDAAVAAEACVATAGYEPMPVEELKDRFMAEASGLADQADLSLTGLQLGGVDDNVIKEIQALERSYAVVVDDCSEPVERVAETVRAEIEREVVSSNMEVLASARAGLRRNSPIADPTYHPDGS